MSQFIPGLTIYKPTGTKANITNPAGQNQNITYASNGKAAVSHRVDAPVQFSAQEATVYLAWPAACTGGGHPELAIKHWGPSHTDSSCCYCYGSAVPSGANLQLGFGGEGPHPNTTTLQTVTKTIPFQAGKQYGFKSIIWPIPGGGAHQELYYDDGTGFKLAGTRNTPTCGKTKTSTAISANAQVEFRIDCANVTYSKTDVSEIVPSVKGAIAAFGTWGEFGWLPHPHDKHHPYKTKFGRPIKYSPKRWATRHGHIPGPEFPHTDFAHSC